MSTVECAIHDNVATLTLSRPECKNALDRQMVTELLDLLHDIRHREDVRAIVLTGANGEFCSGGDVGRMNQSQAKASDTCSRMFASNRLPAALVELELPIIAAVDGVAYGAGFSLALCADFIVVSERARFCMAFSRIGAVPDLGATYHLPALIGVQKARELIYSAREVSAAEAQALGIALEVLPQTELLGRAQELAAAMARMSPIGFAMTKRLLAHAPHNDLISQLDEEASAQAVALTSEYLLDATTRFLHKQPLPFRWPSRTASKPESTP